MDPLGGIPEQLSEATRQRWRKKKARKRAEFIKGPIRVDWVCRLAGVRHRVSLLAAWAILFKAGVAGTRKDLPITPELLKRFGVSQRSGYRALAALEQAGLVKVNRHRGRCPRVTILKGFVG